MKKIDILKKINESIDLSNLDDEKVNKIVDTVKKISDLKKDTDELGLTDSENVSETDDAMKIPLSFYVDKIQDMATGKDTMYFRNELRRALTLDDESKKYDKIKYLYINLQNYLNDKLNENLVNSEIFRIIAENIKPEITKKELIDYVKKKNNG